MSKNYYETLGIDKSSSKDDIKKAFRVLAHKYHPDKKGGDEGKFKEINEAYTVLSDDKKRAEYDAYGRVFSDGAGGNASGAGQGFGGFDFSGFNPQEFAQNFEGFDLGDIFGDFFGGGRTQTQSRRGRDISIDIEISFQDSVFGIERKILLAKTSACGTCKGNGAKPGTEMHTCPTCNGKGKIHEARRSFIGTFSTVKDCPVCDGRGKIPAEKCETCKGRGVLKQEQEITVKIPPGLNDGEVVRLGGAGEAIASGTAGDLYIKVRVKSHHLYKKEGHNLVTSLNIKLSTALLGGEYKLSTLEGDIDLKIPAGISFGEVLRIKGKGVPHSKNNRGDLYVNLNIELPSKLSKNASKIVEELKKEGI